jgi:hypothetical protein
LGGKYLLFPHFLFIYYFAEFFPTLTTNGNIFVMPKPNRRLILALENGYNSFQWVIKRLPINAAKGMFSMFFRILAIILPLLGLPLLGCDKPSLGDAADPAMQEKMSDRQTTNGEKKIEIARKDNVRVADKKGAQSADANKATPLKHNFDKYGIRWSDAKESDQPLVIEIPLTAPPAEIQGPFPENADWRTQEKTPEKKSGKSFWPW